MNKHIAALAALAALMAAFVGAVAPANAQDAGRRVTGEFQSEFGSRSYAVWVPRGYHAHIARPLVVVLHGCVQDANDIALGTRFDESADRNGFLVLYPEQPASINPTKCWRWFDAAHQARGTGETALIAALTRTVAGEFRADTARLYITGISAGGAMAVNVLASYPDLFAGGAVHSAVPYRAAAGVVQALAVMRAASPPDSVRPERVLAGSPAGAQPRPLLVIHGGKDLVVAPANGEQLAGQWKRAVETRRALPLEAVATDTVINGRTARRVIYREGNRGWVEFWSVPELAHAWSGGSGAGTFTDSAGPGATDLIVEFFRLRPPRR